jgi:hypothetical protein
VLLSRAISETIPTLMVGGGDLGHHITTHINKNQWIQEHVVGVVGTEQTAEWDDSARTEQEPDCVAVGSVRRGLQGPGG